MGAPESTLLILLLILAAGLILPELTKRVQIPFVTSIILAGAIAGPHGLQYVNAENEIVSFFGFLGMTFLMLTAGLETSLDKIKKLKQKVIVMAGLNGTIPFIVGVFLSRMFGYDWLPSLLVGTIFISSSIALVIPALEETKLIKKPIGQLILSSVLFTDAVSLVALSFVLQGVSPITNLPIPLYIIVLLFTVVALFIAIPKVTKFLLKQVFYKKTREEQQLRLVIVLTMAMLIVFAALGVHPILAAFIAGIALSKEIKSKIILEKIHTLGYGFFIPIFFFIVGTSLDLSIFRKINTEIALILTFVLALIITKYISGFIGAKIVGLKNEHANMFGITSINQLTTTLAVTYAAASLGILDSTITSAIIIISIITTIIGPALLKYYVVHLKAKKHLL